MRCVIVFIVCFAVLSLAVSPSNGENWPGWRGPRGDGSSEESNPPLHWNGETGENVIWKARVPGAGHSSPIVWEDRIFLTSCLVDKQERVLICVDRKDGNLLWQRLILRAPLEAKHSLNSFASGTPATDGALVYVAFLEVGDKQVPAPNVGTQRLINAGQMVVAAYDFDGRRQWLVKPGGFVSAHGFCTCPVLFKDMIIINGDHDGDSYIVALDKQTGVERWRVARQHKTRSYATPLIREIDGRTQMVMSGSKCIVSFDPHDGSRHWEVDGPTEQFVASMVYDGKLFFMTAGFPDYHVMGIRPDGRGDVTDSHVAWHQTSARCYVPSPVVLDGYLLIADDRGTAHCFAAADGEHLWKERLGKHYSASLVHADGLAYFIADDGITKIVRPGEKLEVVAENSLGEYCFASPAISNGQIFIRGEEHLYCIGRTSE